MGGRGGGGGYQDELLSAASGGAYWTLAIPLVLEPAPSAGGGAVGRRADRLANKSRARGIVLAPGQRVACTKGGLWVVWLGQGTERGLDKVGCGPATLLQPRLPSPAGNALPSPAGNALPSPAGNALPSPAGNALPSPADNALPSPADNGAQCPAFTRRQCPAFTRRQCPAPSRGCQGAERSGRSQKDRLGGGHRSNCVCSEGRFAAPTLALSLGSYLLICLRLGRGAHTAPRVGLACAPGRTRIPPPRFGRASIRSVAAVPWGGLG